MTKQIILSQGKFAIVDDADYDFLMQWKWTLSSYGYAYRAERYRDSEGKRKQNSIWMHRVIMNTPLGMDTDHINGDRLDNTQANLRVVTRSQNNMNRISEKNTTSKYKGVFWEKRRKRWQAAISINKKLIYIGMFKDEADAALAYNLKAAEIFGEHAKYNIAA